LIIKTKNKTIILGSGNTEWLFISNYL